MKNTELELKETEKSLEQSNSKKRELDQNIENLENEKKQLNSQLEGKSAEITTLNGRIKEQDKDLGDELMKIVRLQSENDDLCDQLEEVLISYQNDRDWWKHRADKVLGKRPKSAPPKRRARGEFQNGGSSLARRWFGHKMGPPRLNQSYINSSHKIGPMRPAPAGEEQTPQIINGDLADGSPGHLSAPETTPRPPSGSLPNKPRPKRPMSSYGVRSHTPPPVWSRDTIGYHSDMGGISEGTGLNGYDADDEIFSSGGVHKGDKVMIQSRVTGEEKMNLTGMVKYVSKIGSGGSIFVGLKVDHPGGFGGQEYSRVRLSDIHAVMNPRTRNYSRIRPLTFD